MGKDRKRLEFRLTDDPGRATPGRKCLYFNLNGELKTINDAGEKGGFGLPKVKVTRYDGSVLSLNNLTEYFAAGVVPGDVVEVNENTVETANLEFNLNGYVTIVLAAGKTVDMGLYSLSTALSTTSGLIVCGLGKIKSIAATTIIHKSDLDIEFNDCSIENRNAAGTAYSQLSSQRLKANGARFSGTKDGISVGGTIPSDSYMRNCFVEGISGDSLHVPMLGGGTWSNADISNSSFVGSIAAEVSIRAGNYSNVVNGVTYPVIP